MNELALRIISASVNNTSLEGAEIDIQGFNDLNRQAIFCLPADYLSVMKMPDQLREYWSEMLVLQLRNYHNNLYEQEQITKILQSEGLTPVILKGMSTALYFDKPENRAVGDIDIQLSPNTKENFERARDILIRNGYEELPSRERLRHIVFKHNEIELELHRHFSAEKTKTELQLDELLNNAKPIERELSGYKFYSFDDMINGLICMQHIQHHIDTGLGFRQIVDWLCFANSKLYKDSQTMSKYLEMLDEYGLLTLAEYVQRLGELYFDVPPQAFAAAADEEVVRELYELICRYGDLGKSMNTTSNGVATVLKNGFPSLAEIQRRGLKNWEAAQRRPYLRPFAWAYQLGRYFNRGVLHRGENSGGISDNLEEIRRRHQLMEKLEAGRYRK